ncbi:hypothetical protein HDU87_008614 [Geranomyces variabilis]|uniref:Copper transport protein n=1 Tax=Geranomyces variabilis TaxID=109894 RepID=A0AAD5XQ19_9FUNG|nr:hypothetical protein HDU87_008614 [Geranomyces variabilis]
MRRPALLSFACAPYWLLILVLALRFVGNSRVAAAPVALSPASVYHDRTASNLHSDLHRLTPPGDAQGNVDRSDLFADSEPQVAAPPTPTPPRQRQGKKQIPPPVTTVYVMVVDAPQPTVLPTDQPQQQQRQGKIDDAALSAVTAGAAATATTATTESTATSAPTSQPTMRTFLNTDNSNIALPLPTSTPLTPAQYAAAWICTAVLAYLAAVQCALASKLFPSATTGAGSFGRNDGGGDSRPTSISFAPDTTNNNSNNHTTVTNNIPHHKFKSFISESSVGGLQPPPSPSPPTLLWRIARSIAYMLYKGFATAVFYALVVVAATLNVGLLCAIVVGAMLGAFTTEMCRTARRSKDSPAAAANNNNTTTRRGRSVDEEYTPYLIGG